MSVPANHRAEVTRLIAALAAFEATNEVLEGLPSVNERETLARQIIDSQARVAYTDLLRQRGVDPASADPRNVSFHPLKAAIHHHGEGNFDEAAWMVFLYTHFGMHAKAGWWYVRQMYGACGASPEEWWTWGRIASDPTQFRFWLDDHQSDFATAGPHGFGNHRKYVSLKAWTEQGTGAVVQSYVEWVLSAGGDHAARLASLSNSSPEVTFDNVYRSLAAVRQFGRTARFDFTVMMSRLDLLDATPPHTYLTNATGPLAGARLLFFGDKAARVPASDLQGKLVGLGRWTGVTPDVLEDAVCNWQKYPARYVRFSA